jgi:PAS domain S-box-containing protein
MSTSPGAALPRSGPATEVPEEDFRRMVESVADAALVLLDAEGRVSSWNAGGERIVGFRAEEIVGQHVSRLYPPQELERGTPQRELAAAAAAGRLELEGWRVRKDGSSFWASVVFTAIHDSAGNAHGFATLTRDLTERRQVEGTLTVARQAAEKADLAKSDFLSSMSHELRSPLNAILGFAQLLESDPATVAPSQKGAIAEILRAGWYLLELIDEILDLAQIESGTLSMSREPTSVEEVMLECQPMIEPQAQPEGIRMIFPRFDAPVFVLADRARLKQVLLHLLSNAVKYNQPAGEVVVECVASGGRVRVSVKDMGAVLGPEKLGQLFQPFNRLGQARGPVQGTGIGLVMSKRLVERMGGVIGVTSTAGLGSVFWFELEAGEAPRLDAEREVPAGDVTPLPPPAGPPRTQVHVEGGADRTTP